MTQPPASGPVPRADAFFGLHLDLHPGPSDTALGAEVCEANIAALLDRVRPDFVQYDCKGVPGYAGYPTRVGTPAPGIVCDSLAVWRKVTRERGVPLFIHYCGLWDELAIQQHPDWAVVDAEGKASAQINSVFGPYADQRLIPQLIEAATDYDLDGVWVDADSWPALLDHGPAALAQWRAETSLTEAPRTRSDPHWAEWKAFHRRHYERYLCRWVDALHAARPGLQVTANWMYTTFAPKPIVAAVDYLSGDYSHSLSVDRARVEARYLASTGMPWDLMAWGFNAGAEGTYSLKPALHLQQEAATVIVQGGGFQIYYNPTRSGHIAAPIIETAGQVGDFCRARQAFCHKSVSVPQVALLLSSESQWDRSDAVFAAWGCLDELEGALHLLLENHYSVDVLAEHQLEPRLAEFPLVVVPDSHRLSDGFRRSLLEHVAGGGSLLLLGEKCTRLFEEALGDRFEGEPCEAHAEIICGPEAANASGVWQRVLPEDAEVLGLRYASHDIRRGGEVAATVARRGQGLVGAVYGPVALTHFRTHHPALRCFVADLAARLFPRPMVTVQGPSCVDVALRRTADGRLSVHLVNLAGVQRADRFLSTDFVPPVGPIEVHLRVSECPSGVSWVPDGVPVEWSWEAGVVSVTVPRLNIHGALVVE